MTQHTPSQRAQLTRLPWAQEELLQLQQVQLQVTVVIQHLMIKLPLEAVAVVVNNRAGHLVVLAAVAVMQEATRVDLLQPAKATRAAQAVQQLAVVVVVPGVLVQMRQVIIVVMAARA